MCSDNVLYLFVGFLAKKVFGVVVGTNDDVVFFANHHIPTFIMFNSSLLNKGGGTGGLHHMLTVF